MLSKSSFSQSETERKEKQDPTRQTAACRDHHTRQIPVQAVATRKLPSVSPVHELAFLIDLDIDRLRQAPEQTFDVGPRRSIMPRRCMYVRPENAPFGSLGRTLLRPVKLPFQWGKPEAHAPLRLVVKASRPVPVADEDFQSRAINVTSEDAHAFAVGKVHLGAVVVNSNLLGRVYRAGGDDDLDVATVQVARHDAAVVFSDPVWHGLVVHYGAERGLAIRAAHEDTATLVHLLWRVVEAKVEDVQGRSVQVVVGSLLLASSLGGITWWVQTALAALGPEPALLDVLLEEGYDAWVVEIPLLDVVLLDE
ncbi:hypothetical protein QC762_0029140 [Podospora pseudocomata]|uniref:Uncharacterized protein n=1 Tax=Podospora pseudocomata TaxID=2093779 RepID=A0ABR0GSA4_9PEZI|nr:hypothetical protein QC762_0029140 [Podospora pseudocomata]